MHCAGLEPPHHPKPRECSALQGNQGAPTLECHVTLHFKGKDSFFYPCGLWDALPPDATQKASSYSPKFGCTANHSHFAHPTTLQSEDCYFRRRKRTVAVPSSWASASIIAAAPTSLLVDNTSMSTDFDSCVSNSASTSQSGNNSYSVRSSGTDDNRCINIQRALDTHSNTTATTYTGGMLGAVSTSMLVAGVSHPLMIREIQRCYELGLNNSTERFHCCKNKISGFAEKTSKYNNKEKRM